MLQCCIWLQANVQSALSLKRLLRTASRMSSSNTTGKGHQGNGLFLQVHGNLSFETQSSLAAWDCLSIRELATFPARSWLCLEQCKAALRTTTLPNLGDKGHRFGPAESSLLLWEQNKNWILGLQERGCPLNNASNLPAQPEEQTPLHTFT